ncbi:MAG: bifunctional riboflavin kinase/FAD synthetase [Pseudomonadota bacterium]|nr:bifunctional riboflavin kinase/FAD synthetase [Pseudomonadota bacterium]
MELIRGQHNLRPRHHGCVATIGNFDGVHLGHQAVLRQLAEPARRLGLPLTVITFEPHPQEFFAPRRAPLRLTRLREKLPALAGQGVDRVLCLRFDRRLASMTAGDFIDALLVEALGIRFLVVGDDFRFGHGREGDFALLQAAGARHGFAVAATHTCIVDGARVSSTRIRQALADHDLPLARRLLGRPYAIHGRVVHGDGRGRTLGFPTANVHLHRRAAPLAGVYAVLLREAHGGPGLPGVANLGWRPTVDGSRCRLEVHLLGYQGDLYGRQVEVAFLRHLRPEQRFATLEALRRQIHRDVQLARTFFADSEVERG